MHGCRSPIFGKERSLFRNNQFDSAIYYVNNYLKSPQVYGEANPLNARYILGYSALRQEDYSNALKYFEQITTTVSSRSKPIEQDAYARSADCYFMQKNSERRCRCMITYSIIIFRLPTIRYTKSDHRRRFRSIRPEDQPPSVYIDKRFPNSVILPDADMEIANTYLANENMMLRWHR